MRASSDKPQMQCPRCESSDTKFCYYNNYSVNQPRYFCKNCRRYWTAGDTMHNIPVSAGPRKSKHFQSNSSNTSEPEQQQQIHMIRKSIKSDTAMHESTPPLVVPCFEGLTSSGILNSFMVAAAAQGMSSSSSSSELFKKANSRAATAAAVSPWLFPCSLNFLGTSSSLIYGKPLPPKNAVNGNNVVILQGL